MRPAGELYKIVYESFIPAVATTDFYKQHLKVRMSNLTDNRELFTVSDEAFTLLLLENYYDRWMDIFMKFGAEPPPNRGSKKKVFQSKVKPKYTRGGNVYSGEAYEGDTGSGEGGLPSMNNAGKGKGWTNAGITRFNVLFKEVKQDRINCPLFVKRFLNEKRESKEEVETSKPKKRKEVVIPLDDLGEDLDEFADLDVASTKQEAMDEGSTSSRSRSDDSDEETDYEGIHGVPV